jgi:hypothetical protein
VPDDRTTVTELGTALGTLPFDGPGEAVARRPGQLRIGEETWDRLDAIASSDRFSAELRSAFANGRALLDSPDGLRGRTPLAIEWTGGRRPPGDEVAPIDLRIDHVYLISCKYESDILANVSPGRLFGGLLATTGSWDRRDWYEVVAPNEYEALYRSCLVATGLTHLPSPSSRTREEVDQLRKALTARSYPDHASRTAYADLCQAVSTASALRWTEQLESSGIAQETMLWRLLRIGSAPYFVLGNDRRSGLPARYRIASPWDWRDQFQLVDLSIAPSDAGQPRVDWTCIYRARDDETNRSLHGHVEIRWSHGRFAHPPEAKVYLDSPMAELPGYYPLATVDEPQLTLWSVAR